MPGFSQSEFLKIVASVLRLSDIHAMARSPRAPAAHHSTSCSAGCCTPPVSESLKLGERILNSQILARTFEFCSRIASRGPYGTRNVNCEPLFFRARDPVLTSQRATGYTRTRAPHRHRTRAQPAHPESVPEWRCPYSQNEQRRQHSTQAGGGATIGSRGYLGATHDRRGGPTPLF